MMNRARQLYRQVTQKQQPSEENLVRSVELGRQYEALLKTQGWKNLKVWMQKNREGAQAFMEVTIDKPSAWSLVSLFNHFVRYLFVLQENRAYNKIDSHLDVVIRRGKRDEEKLRKLEEKRRKSQ